jgi:hypothetical protein
MLDRGDRQRRLIRQAVVGLVVAASTAIAELAGFSGPVGAGRAFLFVTSGMLAAAVGLSVALPFKKIALD